MSLISAEIDWLRMLLASHATHPEQLVNFMEIYAQAVYMNINGQGKPIAEWLASEIAKVK